MKSGVHANVFCSALQFGIWYKTLTLKNTKFQAGSRKCSEESNTESKENESLKLLQVFGIDNSALRYVFAAVNYNWTTANNRALPTFVVETGIRFLHLRASWGVILGHADYAGHWRTSTDQQL